ncbi:unnamed protein product, partial [Ectocarpus sp. 8 AP-2014]
IPKRRDGGIVNHRRLEIGDLVDSASLYQTDTLPPVPSRRLASRLTKKAMLLVRRCPTASTAVRRPVVLHRLSRSTSSKPSGKDRRPAKWHSTADDTDDLLPFEVLPQGGRPQQQQNRRQQQQHRLNRLQNTQRQQQQPPRPPHPQPLQHARANPQEADEMISTNNSNNSSRHGLVMLISAFREVSLARRDLGWGVDALAMRLTMLGFLRHGRKNNAGDSGIPQEATLVDRDQGWLDGRASEWQRFLRWAHASYGWTEEVIVKRAGFAPGELEVVALSSGKSRNRPMAPTYVLAVDHGRREIVLSVRGTKAFGDAITITHFRPEPFLDGYAHRGFAQSAHELVKQVEPELTSLAERLPDYRVCFTGHSMGGGIAAMASMLIRDNATRRLQQQQQQHQHGHQDGEPPSTARKRASSSTNLNHRGSRKRRGTAAGGDEISAGAGLGGSEGPEVYSFATPSCVSLELARGCEGWVDSVVHGDDAIPRLSTVSLELLKEDMTAAEWRRAVGRLTDLNTVLSPS